MKRPQMRVSDFDPHGEIILAVLRALAPARTNPLGASHVIRAAMGDLAQARNFNSCLGKWLRRCEAVVMLDPEAEKPADGHEWVPA